MVKAIRIEETGGPEVLKYVDVEVGEPGPGQVRLKQTAVGLNYIDVYHRTGLYPVQPPLVIGLEAAGEVVATGEGVTDLKTGDRDADMATIREFYAGRRGRRQDLAGELRLRD